MPTKRLECIEINPEKPANASIIWLHGLGASGDDFSPIVPSFQFPDSIQARFIFPHAPIMPVTLNFGQSMRAWFDIFSLDREGPQDKTGILSSHDSVTRLIKKEQARGIPSNKIVLAGFSQGGAIALHTGMHYPEQLAGVIALSTFLPLHSEFGEKTSIANKDLPLFWGHGTLDQIVHFELAELSLELLKSHGYKPVLNTYPIAHTVSPDEIRDISTWLQKTLK